MLDFDFWYFVLVGNFLVLLYVLNVLLFKPFLKILQEREDSTTGFIALAGEMGERKEQLLEETKKEFSQAGAKARAEFEALRGEGLQKQKEMLEESGGKAASELERARAELQAVADKAKAALRSDVEKFSDEIVSKLAGV
jgi:F-type H+-transporting ATPase subunit b